MAEPPRPVGLTRAAVAAMRGELPRVGEQTVLAVRAEVPDYADPFSGEMGRTIENAVALALGSFLNLAAPDSADGPPDSMDRVVDAAYGLGRGEARSGRSMEALLSAYRVGARVSWRDMSAIGVRSGLSSETMARFAELVFAFIDQLSAASAAGHADELATSGRVRQRHLDKLALALLRGEAEHVIEAAAHRADWQRPDTLTAVVLPESRARGVLTRLSPLQLTDPLPELDGMPDHTVLLVPGRHGDARAVLLRELSGRSAVVGPAVPWVEARASFLRAVGVLRLQVAGDLETTLETTLEITEDSGAAVDTESHLPRLVLSADPRALADLRAQALAPLAGLRPATVDKLAETLRAWLLHQGSREEMARTLFVHPQTIRYRMGQIREAYGDRLGDPEWIVRLTLALA